LLPEGICWIVRKLYRFGFVPPEGYSGPRENPGRPRIDHDE
jgi:hypothetical protein